MQTHISYVILAGPDVYKIKKPVDLGFLDFSTLEKRRHFCEEEVRLNRRGCAKAYHGVLAVTRSGRGYRLGGNGAVVDYAVHMRRLPAERMMDRLLARGEVTHDMVGRLSAFLARYHAESATGPEVARVGGYEGFLRHWHENFEQARPFVGRTLPVARQRRIEAAVEGALAAGAPLMRRREREGRVRDCHGDLRSDAVCFDPASPEGICIYDCIEFSDRFRWSDVGLDVGFLAMDLDFRGHRDVSDLFVGLYAAAAGDALLPTLLPLFKAYRAYVRGKVEGLLTDDRQVARAQRAAARKRSAAYFRLCEASLRQRPFRDVVLVMGVSGSGKSVLAGALASHLAAALLSTDMVRDDLAGSHAGERERPALDAGLYAPATRAAVYEALLERAKALAGAGHGLVLDGTFLEAAQRSPVVDLARRLGCGLTVVECEAPRDVLERRQAGRAQETWSRSEGRWEVTLAQLARYKRPDEVPRAHRLAVDTTTPLADQLAAVVSRLGRQR